MGELGPERFRCRDPMLDREVIIVTARPPDRERLVRWAHSLEDFRRVL